MSDVEVKEAAVIAHGMRAIAAADGNVHPREVDIIAAFERELPAGTTVDEELVLRPQTHEVFIRSLAIVALADGHISQREIKEIERLALRHGISDAVVADQLLGAKRYFLSTFQGVRVFREAVTAVARELGLPEGEVDALTQDA
jgi:hypothetical protein